MLCLHTSFAAVASSESNPIHALMQTTASRQVNESASQCASEQATYQALNHPGTDQVLKQVLNQVMNHQGGPSPWSSWDQTVRDTAWVKQWAS